MSRPIVAADTNLMRHPTPRRYLTVLEGLRSRTVMVLPSVDRERQKHLPIQARDYIEGSATTTTRFGREARLGTGDDASPDASFVSPD